MTRASFRRSAIAGYAWMSLAVLIWASWLVLTSSGRTTELSVFDLAGLRAIVPTLILAPLLWRARADIARIGLVRCLLLSLYGLPFTLCVGYGLTVAPVAHAGALVPGMMPLMAAILGSVFLGWQTKRRQLCCFALILLASVIIVLRHAGASGPGHATIGHGLFLLGAVCWASFTVTMKVLDVSPYLATAIVGSVSSTFAVPAWIFSGLSNLGSAGASDILFQAVFQGILSGLVALFAFGQAIRLLGVRASVLSATTPGVAALLAVPLLGQVPDHLEILALFVVVVGLAIGNTERDTALARDGASEAR